MLGTWLPCSKTRNRSVAECLVNLYNFNKRPLLLASVFSLALIILFLTLTVMVTKCLHLYCFLTSRCAANENQVCQDQS